MVLQLTGGNGNYSYEWSPNADFDTLQSQVLNIQQTGTYHYKAVNEDAYFQDSITVYLHSD